MDLLSSSVERCRDSGIVVVGAAATIATTSVTDIRREDSGAFGDGISVSSHEGWQATAQITDSWITRSDRAGVAAFGAEVLLGTTTLDCNGIDLNGETNAGLPFQLNDLGANWCGCDDRSWPCAVLSSGLQPPPPL